MTPPAKTGHTAGTCWCCGKGDIGHGCCFCEMSTTLAKAPEVPWCKSHDKVRQFRWAAAPDTAAEREANLARIVQASHPGACKHCAGGPACDACVVARALVTAESERDALRAEVERLGLQELRATVLEQVCRAKSERDRLAAEVERQDRQLDFAEERERASRVRRGGRYGSRR